MRIRNFKVNSIKNKFNFVFILKLKFNYRKYLIQLAQRFYLNLDYYLAC